MIDEIPDDFNPQGPRGPRRAFFASISALTYFIMTGIRLSAIYVIAWATLASYIGAGGLGDLIFSGLSLFQPSLIIGGTIPVILLSLIVDYLLGRLENYLTPRQKRSL